LFWRQLYRHKSISRWLVNLLRPVDKLLVNQLMAIGVLSFGQAAIIKGLYVNLPLLFFMYFPWISAGLTMTGSAELG
jgi:hypothetical protein